MAKKKNSILIYRLIIITILASASYTNSASANNSPTGNSPAPSNKENKTIFIPISFNSLKDKFNNSTDEVERMIIIKKLWNFGAITKDEVSFFKNLLNSQNKVIRNYSALALWSMSRKSQNEHKIVGLNKYIIAMIKDTEFDFFGSFQNILFSKKENVRDFLYDLIKLTKDRNQEISFRQRLVKTLNIIAIFSYNNGYKQSVKLINSAIVSTIIENHDDLSLSSAFILDQNEDIYGKSNRSLTAPIFKKIFTNKNISDEEKSDIAFSFYKKSLNSGKDSSDFLDIIVNMINDKNTEKHVRQKLAYKLSELPIAYLTIPYLSEAAFDNSDPKMQEYSILHLSKMLHNAHLIRDGINMESKEIIIDNLHDSIFPVIAELLKHPYQSVRKHSFKFLKTISSQAINKSNREIKKMLSDDDIRIAERAKAALLIKAFDTKKLKSDIEQMKNIPIPPRPNLAPAPPK